MDGSRRCRPGVSTLPAHPRGIVIIILTALLLTGCHGDNSQPQPQPQPPSAKKIQQLQDTYAQKSYQAMRQRDQDLLKSIESNKLLDRDLANMKLSDRLSEPKKAQEFTYPHSKGYLIKKSSGGQQRLLTVSDYSNAKKDWKNLGLYVRSTSETPHKRVFTGGLYSSDVPDFTTDDHRLIPVASDATGYTARPKSMPGRVTQTLQHPQGRSAKHFQASDVRKRYAQELAVNKKRASDIGTVRRHYRPGRLLGSMQTDGGYLVLGTFSFTETTTATKPKHVTFKKKSRQRKLYPGKYRKTTSSYEAMFAAVVPKHGKITLISGEERQTGLSATK